MAFVTESGFRHPNQRVVFRQIRLEGTITRRQLAQTTDLSFQTIANIVSELVDMELVVSDGLVNQSSGKRAESLKINPDGLYAVGILLGRSGFEANLIDLLGHSKRRIVRSLSSLQPDDTLRVIADVVRDLVTTTNVSRERFAGVGIASPGPIDFRIGAISQPPNFPGWSFVPLQQRLEDMLGCSVSLIKDSHAAALAEIWALNTDAPSSMLYVYISAGIGGALVIDNRLWSGFLGNAGEIGHVVVGDGPRCDCGRQGCLEACWSLDTAARKMQVTVEELINLLTNRVAPYWDDWIKGVPLLARAVVDVVNVLEPEVVLIGGEYRSHICSELVSPLNDALQREGFVHNLRPIIVRLATVERAASIGAGLMELSSALTSVVGTKGVVGLEI